MFCQSCGTKNPEDARFCKACGTSIAQPGGKGGLIIDHSGEAPETDTNGPPLGRGEDTIEEFGPPASLIREEKKSPPLDVENTLAGLRAQSNSSLTNMTLSFATLSVRSPLRSYLVVIGIILSLIAVGALAAAVVAIVYSQNASTIVTTNDESAVEIPPVEIGFPSSELDDTDSLADLSSGTVRQRDKRGTTGQPTRHSSESQQTTGSGKSPINAGDSSGIASPSTGSTSSGGGTQSGEASERDDVGTSNQVSENPESSENAEPSASSGSTGSIPPGFDEMDERDLELDAYGGHVRRIIRRFYAARAQNCFDQATRNNHNLRGTVVVQFSVNPSGNVTRATPVRNTTGDSDLGACLAGQVRSWRLPRPPRDEPVEIQMPFSW